jgi:hypothetical protein
MTYTPKLNKLFKSFNTDQTNNIANTAQQYIDFYHVPSGKSVKFKAMVTAFSDQYTSNWNAEDVYGRMDPISTFQKTGRVINFSFDVVAGNDFEAEVNLARVEALIQMLYPVYSGNTMKNSPMMEIRFGNLIQNTMDGTGLLGYLGGIDYSPNIDIGSYISVGADDISSQYHKVANLSCQFTVLHEHKLGWANKKPINSKFPYGTGQYYDDQPKEATREQTAAAGPPPSPNGENGELPNPPPAISPLASKIIETKETETKGLSATAMTEVNGSGNQNAIPALKAIKVNKKKKKFESVTAPFGTDPGRNAAAASVLVDQASLSDNPSASELAGSQPMATPGAGNVRSGRAIKADFIPADPDGWHGEINLTERRKRIMRENKKYSRR